MRKFLVLLALSPVLLAASDVRATRSVLLEAAQDSYVVTNATAAEDPDGLLGLDGGTGPNASATSASDTEQMLSGGGGTGGELSSGYNSPFEFNNRFVV